MKKQFLTIVLMIVTSAVFAQSPIEKGQSQLNAGFGFSSWGLPVYVGLDYGIHKDFTIGGQLSYRSYSESFLAKDYNSTVIGISAIGNYHFNTLLDIEKEWDVYAGLNLGFNIWSTSSGYPGNHTSGLGLGLQIGGRYYFSSNWAVNLEFGGGNAASGAQIGISYKF